MKLRDFVCLSEVGKDEAVFIKGNYIAESLTHGHKIVLYQIDDFYVEVYMDQQKNEVKKFNGCTRSDLLREMEFEH
jgi:hypothetical protein